MKTISENNQNLNAEDSLDADTGSMTLIEHLIELRKRLITSLLSIGGIFICLVWFANDIYTLVSKPIRDVLPDGSTMIATEITSTFFAPFKLTLFVAFILSAPVILHQIWRFISPGLYAHEKKIAIPLLTSSVLLFYLGIAFAYFVIFPIVMNFFAYVGPEDIKLTPDINLYLNIALKLFFAFGFAFEIPVATLLLIWSGITTTERLSEMRRYVFLFCFIFGMLLTPPDIISQTLLAIPMWLLFEGGIFLAKILPLKTKPAD